MSHNAFSSYRCCWAVFAAALVAVVGCSDDQLTEASTDTAALAVAGRGTPRDLGTLGGNHSEAFGINNRGDVVGSSRTVTGEVHPFLWTEQDGMMDLGTLAGSTDCYAEAINNQGVVVGSCYSRTTGITSPFRWTSEEGMIGLQTPGGTRTYAVDINSNGDAAGGGWTPSGAAALIWTAKGEMIDIGSLGGTFSDGHAISDAGAVAGYSITAGGEFRAFLWTAAHGMTDLGVLESGTVGGDDESEASDVNNRGDVVGFSTTTDWNNRYRAFLWTAKDGMINLGSLGGSESWGEGINDRGQVVGSSSLANGYPRAFLWTAKDGMTDLGIIAGSDGAGAGDINERGEVVGTTYWASGEARATLWPAY